MPGFNGINPAGIGKQGEDGACRVHGGGFAGTIKAYIPMQRFKEYTAFMQAVFGGGNVIPLHICGAGTQKIM